MVAIFNFISLNSIQYNSNVIASSILQFHPFIITIDSPIDFAKVNFPWDSSIYSLDNLDFILHLSSIKELSILKMELIILNEFIIEIEVLHHCLVNHCIIYLQAINLNIIKVFADFKEAIPQTAIINLVQKSQETVN